MLIDIQSMFKDIIETPQQRRSAMQAEGEQRAQTAVGTLSGAGRWAAPLVAELERQRPERSEALQRGLGGMFNAIPGVERETRTPSQQLQGALAGMDITTQEGVTQASATLRNLGYADKALELEQQFAEQARAEEDRTLGRTLKEGELSLQKQRMALAEQEQRSREEQLRLQALRDERAYQVQGFDVANQTEQLRISRLNSDLRAEEIAIQRERNQSLGRAETDQTRRYIMEATTEAIEQRTNATSMLMVAQQYENLQPRSGIFGSSAAAFREFLGTQGGEDAVKQQYIKLRNSDVINGLPPGTASDNDILIFMGGWPPENASASYIASFMRGQAKVSAISSEMNAAKAQYISDNNGNVAGFYDLWSAQSSDEDFLESVQSKYSISFSGEDDTAVRQSLLENMGISESNRRTNTNR